ncbi:MAG TPA: asparagine synthase (glutamine-hydrolyzing) [Polyangiaceae bacterium]|nr:asparagine synthase (glutamine-hydrolyzing) [Polyangiaceae bacterium]
MCGIAGRWLARGGSHAGALAPIEVALDRLAHRGPDDRGSWRSADAALELGHTRLAIIDLSDAGHQPMLSEDGRVVLVYNGELYNHRELRARLEARGQRFRGRSDTEVVLGMYLAFGRRMLSELNGMFALGLFDRESGELWLARDALGIKPLYVTASHDGVAFASELKALSALMPVARALDVAALYRYLSFLWCPGTATPLAAVSRLAPGEQLVVRDGRVVARERWARPSFELARARDVAPRAAQDVAAALRQAVSRQLVADVPVGAFLSGGLDSSAIVAFAREQRPALDCYTIVPEGGDDAGETSDLPYARRVARHLGVRLHEVPVRSSELASELERMVYRLDEPVADPAPLNVLFISELARRQGIKVLLSGAGGDDLFTGYRRHRALSAERAWAWLPARLRRGLRVGSASAARGSMRAVDLFGARAASAGAWARRAAKAFAHADQSDAERLLGYFSWGDPALMRSLFAREQRAGLSATSLYAPMRDFLATLPSTLAPLERMLALEQRFFLGDHNLPYADKMSMAAGVEVRVPFLDADLVALANRLPPHVKQRGRHGKWILKRAMEPFLPGEVIHRAKAGFGAPLRRWVRGELAELVADVLSPERLRDRGLFDPPAVLQLIERNRRGEVDAAYPIFGLCCVELWCRHFVDGRPPARAGVAA